MSRQENSSISSRKNIPHDFDNRGVTHHPSERPSVSKESLNEISVKIISNGHSISSSGSGVFKSEPTTIKQFGTEKPAIRIIPVVKKPLMPVFETSVRGGRIYGGGTSKEALRRAKRKKK
jgi:hypothetical protein